MKAFKAYDIRGIYNVDFSKTEVYKIGFFLPGLLKADKILVGRDVRTSSPEIFEYLTKGITDAGADVYDLGLATTPYVYWATAAFKFDASVQITASHNSKEYNGMKISRTNAFPVGFDSGLNILEQQVLNETPVPVKAKGKLIPFARHDKYMDFFKPYIPDISRLKVSIDCSNGMAALFIKRLLGEKPMYLFFEPDGNFPNHEANPLVPENVEFLKEHVLKNSSDLGIIFDGDADRVMFVDEKGQFISPDLIIAVLAHYFTDKEKGVVLQDIRSSKAVGEYIAKLGYSLSMWRVGRAYAAPKLKEIKGLYGGEFAGHYYFRDFNYSDSGMLACLLVLNVVAAMKAKRISFSQLIKNISSYFGSGEVNFKIQQKQEAMDALLAHFSKSEKPSAFYDFDGYRADFEHWWFNVRPSNTEPYLRFLAEADDPELLSRIVEETHAVLKPFINS
ncbi:MAG TPA: phosphomannomutase/phosphoglucomutase [Bacteroidales bacterium]|nr:phosphomannomutase/phosphoglucomutase [Bacteroidales bacterium]